MLQAQIDQWPCLWPDHNGSLIDWQACWDRLTGALNDIRTSHVSRHWTNNTLTDGLISYTEWLDVQTITPPLCNRRRDRKISLLDMPRRRKLSRSPTVKFIISAYVNDLNSTSYTAFTDTHRTSLLLHIKFQIQRQKRPEIQNSVKTNIELTVSSWLRFRHERRSHAGQSTTELAVPEAASSTSSYPSTLSQATSVSATSR